jgi:hypothetical protein
MSDITWTNARCKISELTPWERNPKAISKRNATRLLEYWQRIGQFQTIAVGPGGEVYDGHQRLSVLRNAYGDSYEIEARQSSRKLTESERAELVALAHVGTTGEWDWDALSSWDAGDLMEWGFDDNLLTDWKRDIASLGNLLESEKPEPGDAEPQIDRAEELREKWGVESGQLWRLPSRTPGQEHRLVCGDCTDAAVLERAMGGEKADCVFTDPPYGVAIGDKNKFLNSFQPSGRNLENIAGDLLGKDDLFDMLVRSFTLTRDVMDDCCAIYVTAPQGGELGLMMMMMMMMSAKLPVRHVLNWIKNSATFSLGRLDYEYQHEPILFTWKTTHKRIKAGAHLTSCWFIDKPRASKEHPTMKPVELYENGYLNSSERGDIVYEPFSGSGTALIAAENLQRQCRAVEISPGYVAVAIQRYHDSFGIRAELVT